MEIQKDNPKKAKLKFATMYTGKPETLWDNFFWTGKTKLEFFWQET